MLGFPDVSRESTSPTWPRRRESPVFAANGMVASAHPLATAAGLAALTRGGNAVDAAVAAAVTASVTMPEMCGLGGDLFAIVHAPAKSGGRGETRAILGSGIAPRAATLEQMQRHGDGTHMPYRGPLAVAVPGMVDAYFALLRRWGSQSFAEVAEAAIGYAVDGFPLTTSGARAIAGSAELLADYPSSSAVFLANGRSPAPGSVLRQPDLAATLRRIATDGADVFYRGEIGQRIARFMAETGGALSADDLAGHATEIADPIATTYRGHTVYQTGLPTQGMILLGALNILDHADLATLGVGTAAGIHLQAEALKLAYADRLGYAQDPAFGATPMERLLSKEWAHRRHLTIDPERAAKTVPAGQLQDGDTTYLCAVDRAGMMVSLIQSVSSNFGCGVVAGDTGVVLNNRAGRGFSLEPGHPNLFAPGKKTMHTLNCYLVADRDGTPMLVGGTPGGDGQPQWNLQVLTALLDAGLDVQSAIDQPRWTVWPGTDPSTLPNPFELRMEQRLEKSVRDRLAARGHRIVAQGDWDGGGAAQAIVRDPATGTLAGGSDSRVEGLALGF